MEIETLEILIVNVFKQILHLMILSAAIKVFYGFLMMSESNDFSFTTNTSFLARKLNG